MSSSRISRKEESKLAKQHIPKLGSDYLRALTFTGHEKTAYLIIEREDGRVLFVHRIESNSWTFPGGGVNPNEDPAYEIYEIAEKIHEQTGYCLTGEPEVVREEKVGEKHTRSMLRAKVHNSHEAPLAEDARQIAETAWILLHTSTDGVAWFSREEADAMPAFPHREHGETIDPDADYIKKSHREFLRTLPRRA